MSKNLIFIILMSFISFSFAQDEEIIDSLKTNKKDFKNTFRFDISGRTLYYSLNYDRRFRIKRINIHSTIGVGDLSTRSVTLNTTLYIVPDFWKINPILGIGHISLFSERFSYAPISVIFSGIEYNRLKRWNLQVLITKLFFYSPTKTTRTYNWL